MPITFTVPRTVNEVSAVLSQVTVREGGRYTATVVVIQANGMRRQVEVDGSLTPAQRRFFRDIIIADLVGAGVIPDGTDS